jgi:hypothetical protein
VAELLVAQKVDVVRSYEHLHGCGPTYVFRDAGVELNVTDAQDAVAAVKAATAGVVGNPSADLIRITLAAQNSSTSDIAQRSWPNLFLGRWFKGLS